MINKDELIYKLEIVIEYLKNNDRYNYELYNRLCPNIGEQTLALLNMQKMFNI